MTNDLQKIRYRNGVVRFTERLHFITSEWMPYHENRGAIVNVTADLGIPLAESITMIDHRGAWYRKMHAAELPEFERRYPFEKAASVTTNYLTFREVLDNPGGVTLLRRELQKGALLANFIRPNCMSETQYFEARPWVMQ